jgi:hypothetical protein
MLEALSAIEDMIADIEADKSPTSREFSIVRTKLEEAEMWLVRGFEVAGIDIGNIGDDEDDEGEDEGEGDEEAEEGGE